MVTVLPGAAAVGSMPVMRSGTFRGGAGGFGPPVVVGTVVVLGGTGCGPCVSVTGVDVSTAGCFSVDDAIDVAGPTVGGGSQASRVCLKIAYSAASFLMAPCS